MHSTQNTLIAYFRAIWIDINLCSWDDSNILSFETLFKEYEVWLRDTTEMLWFPGSRTALCESYSVGDNIAVSLVR